MTAQQPNPGNIKNLSRGSESANRERQVSILQENEGSQGNQLGIEGSDRMQRRGGFLETSHRVMSTTETGVSAETHYRAMLHMQCAKDPCVFGYFFLGGGGGVDGAPFSGGGLSL